MMIQNLLLASESYTHDNWVYKDVFVGFSRLYYIIDGEAYYVENGKAVRFKKNHLYLTPVKQCFTLCENSEDKLLHTYAHITTLPAVNSFVEIKVEDGTPLADAVALWRKYITTEDTELLTDAIQFVLSRIGKRGSVGNTVAEKTKDFIDRMEGFSLDMGRVSGALGYSREHITRSFIAVYRTTPKQYFNQRKMNIALEKLIGGARVNEVADYLNYSSMYSFSKAFKKHFGLSPQKYLLTLQKRDSGEGVTAEPGIDLP